MTTTNKHKKTSYLAELQQTKTQHIVCRKTVKLKRY